MTGTRKIGCNRVTREDAPKMLTGDYKARGGAEKPDLIRLQKKNDGALRVITFQRRQCVGERGWNGY